ncbi:hypothetical protein ACLB2K_030387 [Fragaria x ananassa]
MGNSASQDQTSLRKAMSLCKERQKFLNKASKRRCDLAVAHLQFSGYHKEVADAINAFVGEQNPATTEQSHATTEYIVEMPEDDDDVEVMEEEGGFKHKEAREQSCDRSPPVAMDHQQYAGREGCRLGILAGIERC